MNFKNSAKKAGLVVAFAALSVGLSSCGKDSRGEVVKLADYSHYEYTAYDGTLTDQDVKDYFLETVKNYSEHGYKSFEPDESRQGTKVKKGDKLSLDFVTKVDGTAVENGSAEGFVLTVGEGKIMKELDDGLVGLTVGESAVIEADVPADYSSAAIAGKKISFEVTVNNVLNEVDFTAENAHYYFRYDSTEALLEYIGQYLDNNADLYQSFREDNDKNSFVEYVVENSEFAGISGELTNRNHCFVAATKEAETKGKFTHEDYADSKGFKTVESFINYSKNLNETDIKEELAFAEIASERGYTLSDDEFEMLAYKEAIMAGYFISTNESGADVPATIERFRTEYEKAHGKDTFETHIKTLYYEQKAFEELSK